MAVYPNTLARTNSRLPRSIPAFAVALCVCVPLSRARAQAPTAATPRTAVALSAAHGAPAASVAPSHWRRFAAGFAASILFHESAHIATAVALGAHPTFGFDKMRPTVFSGLDFHTNPHQQFLFSAAGLTAQTVLDELLLDVPQGPAGPFERGVLAGGLGTTLFYLTI